MQRCDNCHKDIIENTSFCLYCGAAQFINDKKPPNLKRRKNLLVILIGIAAALLIALLLVFFLRPQQKVRTFDFTCKEFTEEINKLLGEYKLDENHWELHKEKVVYADDNFDIRMETDTETKKATKISVGPADTEFGVKMATATLMVIDPEMEQKEALQALPAYKDDKEKLFIFEPRDSYSAPLLTDTTEALSATSTDPAPSHTQAANTYTAMELIDKDLSEIISIMGGDFDCQIDKHTPVFGSSNMLWIYNDDTLPGLAFHPITEFTFQPDDLTDAKEKLKQGLYSDYTGISIMGKGRLNNAVSADMSYRELAAQLGDFEVTGFGQGTFGFFTTVDGYNVTFVFPITDELFERSVDGVVSSEAMNAVNPTLHSIALRRNETETTSAPTTEASPITTEEEKAEIQTEVPIQTIHALDSLTLSGTLIEEEDNNTNFHSICVIMNLDQPLTCYLKDNMNYDGTKVFEITSVQVGGNDAREHIGEHVTVTGTVVTAHTAHHLRDIVLTDTVIS